VPPAALRVPRELVDLDGAWITSRAAVMVIVYNTKRFDPNTAPKSYAELADPRLKGQVIFGDPLASGTFFTTVAFLQDRFGWEYFDRLKQNGLLSTGGNSAVIERVSSGELGTGLVLLENVLAAKRKGAPIDYLLPAEGPVLIPGPAAIFAGTANPAGAKALMDLIFSPEAQALLVEQGDMHSPDPRQAPPEGAPPWDQLMKDALPWSERFIEQVEHNAAELRSTYNQRVQR
jgi:iron(III) transport system substrate-binding protein